MLTQEVPPALNASVGIPLAKRSRQLITSLLLDKGKPAARLGRKATGQVNPDSRVTEGRIRQFGLPPKPAIP